MARPDTNKYRRSRLRSMVDPDKLIAEVQRIKPISEWDWEELRRGHPRGPKGQFGARPHWADVVVNHPEVQRRYRTLAASTIRQHVGTAIESMVQLMTDDSTDLDGRPVVPASVRQRAAEYIIDQTVGKATAAVQIEAGGTFKELLAQCMVNDDGEDAHPMVLPGEVIYDEEEEDGE